ncbi:hypothetical protein ACOMHN_040584 [Nucella lapillus]
MCEVLQCVVCHSHHKLDTGHVLASPRYREALQPPKHCRYHPGVYLLYRSRYCAMLHSEYICIGKYGIRSLKMQAFFGLPFSFAGHIRVAIDASIVISFDYNETWNMAAFVLKKEWQVRMYRLPDWGYVSQTDFNSRGELTVPTWMYPAKQFSCGAFPCDVAFCKMGSRVFLAVCFEDTNIIDLVDPRPPGHVYLRLDQCFLCRPVRMDFATYQGTHYLTVAGKGGNVFVMTLEQKMIK